MPLTIKPASGSGSMTLISVAGTTTNDTLTLPAVTGTVLTTGATVTVAQGGTGITSFGTGVATALGNATNGASGICVQDASGNLGLGVTPSAWSSASRVIQWNYGGIGQYDGATSDIYSNAYWNGANWKYMISNYAVMQRCRNDSGQFQWHIAGSGAAGGNITFSQAMTLDASGNLGIGTTSPATRLHVDGTIRYTNRPAAGTITAIGFDTNGDLKASSSSLRYKENIINYNKGLSEVLNIRPVTFNFIGEDKLNAGFIVEEIDQEGLEEFVLRNEDGHPDAIPYGNMVALLTKAIQELSAKLDAAEARIAALEAN